MLPALLTMVGLAAAAGVAAAFAARRSTADQDRLIDEIDALLPQTQCGRCTFVGCRPYATALANGEADINQCPPGGDATAAALARLLNREARPVDPRFGSTRVRASAA
jgi:electron transport complex protein RnfB